MSGITPLEIVGLSENEIMAIMGVMLVDAKLGNYAMENRTIFKIGELSRQTGLTVGTLRYYSDRGLLQPIERRDNGYRYYDWNAVQQVDFIKKARALGFSLEEIKQVLDVRDRGEKPCPLVQNLLNLKIEQLRLQIEQMKSFKSELEKYHAAWTNTPNLPAKPEEVCPLISSVSLKGQTLS